MPLHGDKGVIYFALNTETNLVKIGFTQQPKERKASLRRELGSELEYLKMVQSDTYLEIYIHEKFRHLRVEGEWFRYEEELRNYITSNQPEKDGRSFKRLMAPLNKKHRIKKENMQRERKYWIERFREERKRGEL